MVEYRPVTESEWNYLVRRFVGLELAGMRALFDRSLPGSPYTPAERRGYRRAIYETIRLYTAPTEAFPNPYFELTWFRAATLTPSLWTDPPINRIVLWDAFFRPDEPAGYRQEQIRRWQELSGGEETELPIVTDKELEVSE